MPPNKICIHAKFHVCWCFGYLYILREEDKEEEKHGKTVKYSFTSITPVLQGFADFFSISLAQHVPHFGNGRSQIEWNMKVKIEISICTGLMLNDHSNPYIESITVLSDTCVQFLYSYSLRCNIYFV